MQPTTMLWWIAVGAGVCALFAAAAHRQAPHPRAVEPEAAPATVEASAPVAVVSAPPAAPAEEPEGADAHPDPEADPVEDPAMLEREQQGIREFDARVAEIHQRLSHRWETDVRDPDWAEERERVLQERLEGAGVLQEFEEIACKESVCRMVLPEFSPARMPVLAKISGVGSPFAVHQERLQVQPDADRLLIYLAREGFPMPEFDDSLHREIGPSTN
ncbi:MAG: hypothetical protein OXT09_08185 [Myxococcales bacterium]|nr:hypothetical protein [Myxococcales bacterium]